MDEKSKEHIMSLNLKELKDNFGKNITFKTGLSKLNWFNLGGPAKILFKPDNENQLKKFLIQINNSHKIICLGAGSNTLVRDGGFDGAVIKLSPKFSYIKKIQNNTIEVGAATLDKTLSRFSLDNSLVGFEFLSCIPGSIGGAIKMNSGCYGDEISRILLSIKAMDLKGNILNIKKDNIKFFYRGTNIPNDLIILSANFISTNGKQSLIQKKIEKYIQEKKKSQPTQVKTCGSTFKNPENNKAWKLIKESDCNSKSFGKASISKKHCNFFINDGGSSADDIEKLINYVKKKVLDKHNINLDLEIKIIGEKEKNEK